jgi:hypothetical protein
MVHISNMKQFFLQTGMVTKGKFKDALRPLHSFQWIDLHSFIYSIEALLPKSKRTPVKVLKDAVKMSVFELIFYYCLFSTIRENELGKDEMRLTVSLAFRDFPYNLTSELLFVIFSDARDRTISFKSFYQLILSLE